MNTLQIVKILSARVERMKEYLDDMDEALKEIAWMAMCNEEKEVSKTDE